MPVLSHCSQLAAPLSCGGLGLTWLVITVSIVADDVKKSRLMLKVSKLCNNWPALPLTLQTLQLAHPDQACLTVMMSFEATFPRLQDESGKDNGQN